MDVTEKKLAAALDGQWVYARNRDGTHHGQVINHGDVAADLMEKLGGSPAPEPAGDLDRAYVINGDDLRIALNGMNGRWASVANPRTMAGDILDAIAQPAGTAGIRVTESSLESALEGFYVRVGSPVGMGTSRAQIVGASETAKALFATLSRMAALREDDSDDVVDAHICCEHDHADRELQAIANALAALNANDWRTAIRALHHLNVHELARAVRWLADRFPALDELPF